MNWLKSKTNKLLSKKYIQLAPNIINSCHLSFKQTTQFQSLLHINGHSWDNIIIIWSSLGHYDIDKNNIIIGITHSFIFYIKHNVLIDVVKFTDIINVNMNLNKWTQSSYNLCLTTKYGHIITLEIDNSVSCQFLNDKIKSMISSDLSNDKIYSELCNVKITSSVPTPIPIYRSTQSTKPVLSTTPMTVNWDLSNQDKVFLPCSVSPEELK